MRRVTVRQLFKVLPLGDKQAQELVITPTILLITQNSRTQGKATSEQELPNTSVNKRPKTGDCGGKAAAHAVSRHFHST